MSKWTPGPWAHSKTSNISNMVVGPNNSCVATVQAEYVARKTVAQLDKEQAANIALIAAAPEMAELLQLALDTDNLDEDDPVFAHSRDRIHALLERINK